MSDGPSRLRDGLLGNEAGRNRRIVPGDAVIRSQRKEITEFAAKVRRPAVYFGRDYIDAGGLMSYGPDGQDIGRRAAAYVANVLKGAKPADLPIEEVGPRSV